MFDQDKYTRLKDTLVKLQCFRNAQFHTTPDKIEQIKNILTDEVTKFKQEIETFIDILKKNLDDNKHKRDSEIEQISKDINKLTSNRDIYNNKMEKLESKELLSEYYTIKGKRDMTLKTLEDKKALLKKSIDPEEEINKENINKEKDISEEIAFYNLEDLSKIEESVKFEYIKYIHYLRETKPSATNIKRMEEKLDRMEIKLQLHSIQEILNTDGLLTKLLTLPKTSGILEEIP
jgi:hypothetical protein